MIDIVEFYQINHLSVLLAVVFFLGIYILKLKTRILVYISKQEEYNNKKIRIGSIVKLKYILTGEVVTLQISEYQSGVIENQSKIRRINSKMPLAVSLLDKEVGDIVKFKVNISDEKEVYVEVLKFGFEIEQQPKEVIVEVDKSKIKNESEASNDEIQPTEFSQLKEADDEIPYVVPERIRIGSIVRLKYISTDEIILILITEYESGKIENQPDINVLYYKKPLAVALLNKESGDKVEFRLNELDENEVKVEVLAINNEFVDDFEEEIITNEVNPIKPKQNREVMPITPLQDMSEGFRRWLSVGNNYNGRNYALGTVIAYSNAIRSLSEHLTRHTGQRVNIYNLSVQSIDELERINQLYSLGGRYSEFGNTAHGTYRNAMVAYVRFIKSLNRN
jgi:transcription elongation GreA/GreB family factor